MMLPMVRLERANPWFTSPVLWPLSYTAQFGIAGKELSLSSWCIASLYIYQFSTVIDLSFREVQLFYWTKELLVPVVKFDEWRFTFGILTVNFSAVIHELSF